MQTRNAKEVTRLKKTYSEKQYLVTPLIIIDVPERVLWIQVHLEHIYTGL